MAEFLTGFSNILWGAPVLILLGIIAQISINWMIDLFCMMGKRTNVQLYVLAEAMTWYVLS